MFVLWVNTALDSLMKPSLSSLSTFFHVSFFLFAKEGQQVGDIAY